MWIPSFDSNYIIKDDKNITFKNLNKFKTLHFIVSSDEIKTWGLSGIQSIHTDDKQDFFALSTGVYSIIKDASEANGKTINIIAYWNGGNTSNRCQLDIYASLV